MSSKPFAREGSELDFDLAHQFVDAEVCEFRPQGAGIEPRHIEQRTQYFLDRLERGIDVVDQAPVVLAPALDEAGDVESRRVKRLQDVVAGGCEETLSWRFGRLRFALGMGKRGVEASQFLGSFPHPPFKCFVRRSSAWPPRRWG